MCDNASMEPRINFEDNDILVLDKPAGLIVNRADTTKGEKTVQEWVETKFKIQNSKFKIDEDSDFYKRAGIVHRLDKETSGILLVAKTREAFENLQKQFKERKVKKTYVALVHGRVESSEGEIKASVGRLPWNRKRFGVLAGGREAITKYQISRYYDTRNLLEKNMSLRGSASWRRRSNPQNLEIASLPRMTRFARNDKNVEPLTLLELHPKTGRTHQIRVHLKYFGHPIFSDPLYAGRKTAKQNRKLLPRIFLHASKISFYHPKTNNLLSFESVLPEELKQFLNTVS